MINVNSAVDILKKQDLSEKSKKISQTVGSIGLKPDKILAEIDESSWGRILVGALGYIGDESILPSLFKLLNNFRVDENRYAVCGAIGNVVSRAQGLLVGRLM